MKRKNEFIALTLLCLLILLPSISFAQLTGIKYIGGTSPDYATIELAINDLNLEGVGEGGVTFLIRDGIYNESDNLTILDVVASAENPVVFRPDVGAIVEINITITGDFSYAFKIHNSDYISFNGTPYGSDDNSRNMTINGIRNGEDDVFVLWIANGSDHITLENMIINSISDPLYDTGWSTPVYCSTYEVPSPLVGMDSFTLSNCEVIGGSTYGVFMDGDTGIQLSNFNIINNDVHDFQKYGIYVWAHIVDCNVEGNEVYQTFEEARSSVYGIRAGSSSCSGTTTIHHNYIHDMKHSANAHPYGIFMTSNSHDNLVYNNIIYLVPGLTANTPYCIYMSSGDNTNNQIYYNTLYIGGVNTRQYVDSYCIKIYKDASDNILKDNILINERTGDVSGNDHCAIYLKTATSFAESDYNFLTVNSDNSFDNRYVARIGSNYYNTLGDLQGSPGYSPRDQNSLTGNPDLSFPDLHLNSTSLCIGAGTPITGIITDFDYDIRDETNPDIGADEFISIHAEFCADTTQGYAPLTVQFTDLSIPQGSIISWEWDFDYDGTIDSYEQNPEWIYDEAGIYTVSLTVIGEDFADTETKEDYITVFPGIFAISGNIGYFSDDAPVPNALLELTGDNTYSTTTAESGDYLFSDISCGNYVSTPSKDDDLDGLSGLDASRIARYAALLYEFDCFEMISADVSMNGNISGTDASRVARYVALLINELNPDGIDWVFTPEPIPECEDWPPIVYESTREYSPLDSDLTDEDFIGIRLGDVSGNWSPDSRVTLSSESFEAIEIETNINSILKIPIVIENITAIEGIDIEIAFNPEVLKLTELSLNGGILENKNYGVETNLEKSGQGLMVIYAKNELVSEKGIVAFIEFDVIGEVGSSSEIRFTKFDVNETEHSGGLQVVDSEGNEIVTQRLAVNVVQPIPEKFALYPNYPNPFDLKTVIHYDLPQDTYVNIQIYNVKGQLVKELINGIEEAGRKHIEWDAEGMSSGIYFYKLSTQDKIFIKKMLLLR